MCRVRTVGPWRTPWSAGVGPRSGCVVHESVGVGHAGAGRGHRRWFVSRADLPAWWPAAVPFRGSCQPGGRPVFVYDVSRPGIGPGQRHGRRPPHSTYATRSKGNIPCPPDNTATARCRCSCATYPGPVSAQVSGMVASCSTRRMRRVPRGTSRAPRATHGDGPVLVFVCDVSRPRPRYQPRPAAWPPPAPPDAYDAFQRNTRAPRTTPRRPGCLVPLGSSRPGVPPAATGRAPPAPETTRDRSSRSATPGGPEAPPPTGQTAPIQRARTTIPAHTGPRRGGCSMSVPGAMILG